MGRARILLDAGKGQYSVAVGVDVSKVNRMKESLAEEISKANERLDKATDPTEIEAIELTIAALEQELKRLEGIPTEHVRDVWCADYTEHLSGYVGLIELGGSGKDGLVIRPGFEDGAVYDPQRDGIWRPTISLNDMAWLWDVIIGPSWQKWRYPYRAGVIKHLNGNYASVEVDTYKDRWMEGIATGSPVVVGGRLYDDVPIHYMDCNGEAFRVDDHVVVKMEKDEAAEIIGFVTNPRPCEAQIIIFAVFLSDGSYGLESGRRYIGKYIDGVLKAAYDINGILGSPKDTMLRVFEGISETNSVLIAGLKKIGEENGHDIFEPVVVRLPIDWNTFEIGYYVNSFNDGESEFTGASLGGYRISVLTYGWAGPMSIAGAVQKQPIGHDDFQVIAATWLGDFDGDNIIDSDEVYPSDYRQHCYRVRGVTTCRDQVILCLWRGKDNQAPYEPCDPENQEDCRVLAFEAPHYEESIFYWGAEPSYMQNLRAELLDIGSWADFNEIAQMQAVDGMLYIARHHPARLTAYDIDAGMAVTGYRVFEGWDYLGKITVVRWRPVEPGDEYRLTVMPYNSGSDRGPMYALNWVTLETKKTVNFASWEETDWASAVGVRAYSGASNIIEMIHQYRRKNGVNSPIAYSGAMADVSYAYAKWLAENGTVRHEDYEGRGPMERFRPYNFWGVSENLAIVVRGSEMETLERAIAEWDESPGHKANLLVADAASFSWAEVPLGAQWRQVIMGPGRYDPVTHSYTTTDTIFEIPEAYIGKMAICVFNITIY